MTKHKPPELESSPTVPLEELFKLSEAADRYHLSMKTLLRAIRSRDMGTQQGVHRIGRNIRVELERFLRALETPNGSKPCPPKK